MYDDPNFHPELTNMKPLSFTYKDQIGSVHVVEFVEDEYFNLMELLRDRLGEEIGDCRGRAWCGSCHVYATSGHIEQPLLPLEQSKLAEVSQPRSTSRLSCQLLVRSDLSGAVFEFSGE